MKICTKCEEQAVKRGLCNRHYEELRRKGAYGVCKVDGCGRGVIGKGFCAKHLHRFNRYGDPLHLEQPKLGNTKHPNYLVWLAMIERCFNPNSGGWDNYGGRGITMCERWRKDFWAFVEDMGPKPSPKHTIERIDNDGNYEPGNCRWLLRALQSRNRRNSVLTLRRVMEAKQRHAKGEKIAALAREFGIKPVTLRAAIIGQNWPDAQLQEKIE